MCLHCLSRPLVAVTGIIRSADVADVSMVSCAIHSISISKKKVLYKRKVKPVCTEATIPIAMAI